MQSVGEDVVATSESGAARGLCTGSGMRSVLATGAWMTGSATGGGFYMRM